MMLFIEAHDMTADDVSELRQRHNINVTPGFRTKLTARKVENRIVWSITRMKEGYCHALDPQEHAKEAIVLAA